MGVSPLDALALAIAIVSASSATTWFALMPGHPIMKACWRLQLAAIMQIPAMIHELRKLDASIIQRWKQTTLWVTVPVGALMGAHFSLVSACVTNTSLSHAVLVINTAPLFLVAGTTLRFVLSALGRGAGLLEEPAQQPASAGATGTADSSNSTDVAVPVAAVGNPRSFSKLEDEGSGSGSSSSSAAGTTAGADGQATAPGPGPAPQADAGLLDRLSAFLAPSASLPPTSLETFGACLAFLGVAGLVVSANNNARGGGGSGDGSVSAAAAAALADDARASWTGDLMGLGASLLLCYYWVATSYVRKWCPLFAWLCPINAAAAATCALFSLAFLPGHVLYSATEPVGVFSWVNGGDIFWYALGAAVFASSMGHGLAAWVIGRVGPLPVSVSMLMQPPTGMGIGFLAGVQGPPGLAVLACAPVILYGAFLVTVGGREKGLGWSDVLACRIRPKAAAEAGSEKPTAGLLEDKAGSVASVSSTGSSIGSPGSSTRSGGSTGVGSADDWGEPIDEDPPHGTSKLASNATPGARAAGQASVAAGTARPGRVRRASEWGDPAHMPHVPRLLPVRQVR